MICNFDCLNCVYSDCVNDELPNYREFVCSDDLDKQVQKELNEPKISYSRQQKYNHTPKGIANRAKHNASAKGKARQKRYAASDKGKETAKRFSQSERRKLYLKEYTKTEEYKQKRNAKLREKRKALKDVGNQSAS